MAAPSNNAMFILKWLLGATAAPVDLVIDYLTVQ